MFPFRVQNAKHNDATIHHTVEKFVRKSASEQAAKIAVIKWTAFRIGFQLTDRRVNFNQHFIAQTSAL